MLTLRTIIKNVSFKMIEILFLLFRFTRHYRACRGISDVAAPTAATNDESTEQQNVQSSPPDDSQETRFAVLQLFVIADEHIFRTGLKMFKNKNETKRGTSFITHESEV